MGDESTIYIMIMHGFLQEMGSGKEITLSDIIGEGSAVAKWHVLNVQLKK